MKASTQFPSVETAVNSDNVMPAANGCCVSVHPCRPVTHVWRARPVLVSHVNVLDVHLHIVHHLRDDRSDVGLLVYGVSMV